MKNVTHSPIKGCGFFIGFCSSQQGSCESGKMPTGCVATGWLALARLCVGRLVAGHGDGLLPVIRPVSHLLPIRHLIICNFSEIYPNSGHLNVNKNNCNFAQFIFGFHRSGILPDWHNNRYYPISSLTRARCCRDILNSATTTKDIF